MPIGRSSRPLSIIAAFAIGAAAPAFASSDDTIKIAINEWTGQQLSAHIVGGILTETGHQVEYIVAGTVPQWSAISEGTLHLQPEVWTNITGDLYPKAVEAGDIVVVGTLGLEAKEGWFYPPYMNEMCPGLPSYQALYDCAQAFATAETFPNGRLITYPADWGTRSKDQVAAIGLPFNPVAGGSEGAMIAEIKAAVDAKQPLMMMFWQPHWVHSVIDLDLVEWDSSSPDCLAGVDQERGKACGFAQANVEKAVNRDFQTTWPEAYSIVEKFQLTNDVQNALIHEVDQKGRSVEEVAAEWVSQNEATWRPYVN